MVGEAALRGMTWDHSRGYEPMVATAAEFSARNPGISISWDRRSLQAFADRPLEEMAGTYDLMVIDHPHIGEAARTNTLLPLDGRGRDAELAELACETVGQSHSSYEYDGRQWALAIDAATPVAAYRPDQLAEPPARWGEVLELARDGRVAFALVPINALMTFLGLARNNDVLVAATPDQFMPDTAALEALETLLEITALLDPRCLKLDPIGIYEWLGRNADAPAYSPFGYGYTNYSRNGYCPHPLVFADAPGLGDNGPRGTVLGGTGIAVSSATNWPEAAIDYAFYVAGSECQSSLYFESGGQPGNAAAWESDACNNACRNFFRNTRRTLDTAWLRPRHAGYMHFQNEGCLLVHACLRGEATPSQTVARLQQLHRQTASDIGK